MALARQAVGGAPDEDTPAAHGPSLSEWKAALAQWGFADEQPETTPAQDLVQVWPCNWPVLMLFMACSRHWKLVLGGMGGAHWQATDPLAVQQIMRWQGVGKREQAEMWRLYVVMENEALRLMNEREAEGAKKAAG